MPISRDRRAPAPRLAQQCLFDIVESFGDFAQDQPVGGGLIDLGNVPIEDGAVFVDELAHVGDDLPAMTLQLDPFELRRFAVSPVRRRLL